MIVNIVAVTPVYELWHITMCAEHGSQLLCIIQWFINLLAAATCLTTVPSWSPTQTSSRLITWTRASTRVWASGGRRAKLWRTSSTSTASSDAWKPLTSRVSAAYHPTLPRYVWLPGCLQHITLRSQGMCDFQGVCSISPYAPKVCVTSRVSAAYHPTLPRYVWLPGCLQHITLRSQGMCDFQGVCSISPYAPKVCVTSRVSAAYHPTLPRYVWLPGCLQHITLCSQVYTTSHLH